MGGHKAGQVASHLAAEGAIRAIDALQGASVSLAERLRGLTHDHPIVGEFLRRHEISEEDAAQHPHRHVLTPALGVRPRTEPDLAEMTPLEGDVFIPCSDGLTGHVDDAEIAERVASESDLEVAGQELVDAANRAGGRTTSRFCSCATRREPDRELAQRPAEVVPRLGRTGTVFPQPSQGRQKRIRARLSGRPCPSAWSGGA